MRIIPETVSAYSFDTVYRHIRYTVFPAVGGIRQGDAWVDKYVVYEGISPKPKFNISVKLSGSLVAVWQLQIDPEKSNKLMQELGQAAIVLGLEEDTQTDGNQITFDSYNTAPAIELQTLLLKQKHESVRDEQSIFMKTVLDALKDQQQFKTESHKDYLNFKMKNIAEIRGLLLQLASVSAVIVAGILALGHSSINGWVVASVVIFVAVGGFASFYVFHILENVDKDFRKTIVASEKRVNEIEKKEKAFLEFPSATTAKELNAYYMAQHEELDQSQLTNVQSDWKAWVLLAGFLVGLLLLAGGYLYQNWDIVGRKTILVTQDER